MEPLKDDDIRANEEKAQMNLNFSKRLESIFSIGFLNVNIDR